MRISPISFGTSLTERIQRSEASDLVNTVRHNSLSDMEFNIIADTIRCQNLRNQMNVRLSNLRRNLNSYIAKNVYNA